jgi:hypothetical protein
MLEMAVGNDVYRRYVDASVAQCSASFAELLQLRLLTHLDQTLAVQHLREYLPILPSQPLAELHACKGLMQPHAGSKGDEPRIPRPLDSPEESLLDPEVADENYPEESLLTAAIMKKTSVYAS